MVRLGMNNVHIEDITGGKKKNNRKSCMDEVMLRGSVYPQIQVLGDKMVSVQSLAQKTHQHNSLTRV